VLYAIYVLLEKKVIISGRLSGNLYQLEYPANIIVAFSLLLGAIFVMLVLVENQLIKKINPVLFLFALILFAVGALI
jgi:hypothetical protein